jgi:hypothetical protein
VCCGSEDSAGDASKNEPHEVELDSFWNSVFCVEVEGTGCNASKETDKL